MPESASRRNQLFGKEGRSYAYNSRATGYGRGEGVAVLLLKPLDTAIRDKDNIRALIRKTGVNQDGKTNGITFPSVKAQAKLIQSVYRAAGFDPADTDYIKAHGTGTAAGDPVEAEALSRAFTKGRRDEPLIVGSVKTNIGHLEAASGLAGIIKTIYTLERGVIPPSINFEIPNKNIPLDDWSLKVPTTPQPWPSSKFRRASINNFGFGGTNAHVILEHYDTNGTLDGHASTDGPSTQIAEINGAEDNHPAAARRLFLFSAKDKSSLRRQMNDIASYLTTTQMDEGNLMERLAFTLCQRRSVLDWREAATASETLKEKKPERPGGILAVGVPPETVRLIVKRLGSAQVVVTCVNRTSLVTASRDERGISRLQTLSENDSLLNRRLKVDIAYHSPHMEDISLDYLHSIKEVEPNETHDVDFHSSVRGRQIATETLDAEYWVENMTSPVVFLDGVQSMYRSKQGPEALIEIGPHSTLESPIRDILKNNAQWGSKVRYFCTLRRGEDAVHTTLSLASSLLVLGCDLNFEVVNYPVSSPSTPLGDLPSYPWNHSKRHWHKSRLSINHRLRRFPRSNLLGSLVNNYNDLEPRWRNILRIPDIP
ncbi:MAG: hypothetical protein Q9181_006748 [Wetmoreana brouardii]